MNRRRIDRASRSDAGQPFRGLKPTATILNSPTGRERRRFWDARRLHRRAATTAQADVAGARRTVWCACAAARRTRRCRKKEPPRRVGNTPSPTRSRPSRHAESESLEINPLRSRCALLTSEAIELLSNSRIARGGRCRRKRKRCQEPKTDCLRLTFRTSGYLFAPEPPARHPICPE
jgi:hypothetical protein